MRMICRRIAGLYVGSIYPQLDLSFLGGNSVAMLGSQRPSIIMKGCFVSKTYEHVASGNAVTTHAELLFVNLRALLLFQLCKGRNKDNAM
jgi:hypothetical protein